MFGTKLRTWMEAHIVRSKKKKDRKKGEKGFDSNCNSPRSCGANKSSALHQVHPVDSLSKNVDGIRLQGEEGRCGSATVSSATSTGTGSVNLSSPESAYSTGYSTDGTSPGSSYPPEYYINIRTGTHYFQSHQSYPKAGTGSVGNNNNNNNNVNNNNNNSNSNHNDARTKRLINPLSGSERGHGRFYSNVEPSISNSSSTSASAVAFVPGNTARTMNKLSRDVRTSTPDKVIESQENYNRRTESFSAESSRSNLHGPSSCVPTALLSPAIHSPRERSRIRTNPWLTANSSGSSTGFKSRLNFEDTSSGSDLKFTESSGSANDVNVSSTREGRAKRELRQKSLSAGRSPINQNWRIASGMEIRPKISLSVQRRDSSSSDSENSSSDGSSNVLSSNENRNEDRNANGNGSSASSVTRSARSSEDDITLNEMMGKFDESYVYEKETDILSDSDPTDCEDYVESMSDVNGAQDAGYDNQDLDYIDNGSFLDLNNLDGRFPNTGHCTYFAFTGELARRSSRLRESLMKRRSEAAMLQRTVSVKNAAKRQISRHKRQPDEKTSSEKRKKRFSQRRKSNFDSKHDLGSAEVLGIVGNDDETANLNRVLVERMLLKNSGFNQGSRSVGGTPISLRRKKHDINKNLSSLRSDDDRSSVRPVDISGEDDSQVKRRSNSVSYMNGNGSGTFLRRRMNGNPHMTTFASEIALLEADKEADKKYRELILEAETILMNMQKKNQNSLTIAVPSPSRKLHNGLANKRVQLIKNTELNIELALSKSRNSQPELQSGSIKDLEHTSPKRQLLAQQPTCHSPLRSFAERVSMNSIKRPIESPLASRRSSDRSSLQTREQQQDQQERSFLTDRSRTVSGLNWWNYRAARSSEVATSKEEGVTSSSSDSEDRCDVNRKRAPLMMTFRSIDMGPIKEGSSYCPQSEPVKRKVYAGSTTYDKIQKTLGEHVTLRNSDGDTGTDDTDDSRRCLKENVTRVGQDRLTATANVLNGQESQPFQHRLTQLRRQMLMQTIQGLKRSLEDQSATLKQTCLETVMAD